MWDAADPATVSGRCAGELGNDRRSSPADSSAAAVAAGAALGALFPAAASAAATATITFTRSSLAGAEISSDSAAAANTITCFVSIDNPHKSTHVPTNANVESHVTCTFAMTSLSITTKLWRSGGVVATKTVNNSGLSWLNGNAAARCSDANYQGTAKVTAKPPLGWVPSSASTNVASPVVSVDC